MFIQNAVYKAVPTDGLTFPLAEGTVITVGDVTGIVPENIALAAPTGLIYLATGGTIDLTSEANAGVTFTDEQLKELGGDFNFIPMTEAGSSSLPSYTSQDIGKVLTVGEGSETVHTVIVPEQTVTVSNGPATLTGADVSGFVVGNTGVMIVNGVDYDVAATVDYGATAFGNPDSFMIGLVNGNALFVATAPGTYTVSLTVSAPSVEPKWEALIPTYPIDGAFELEVEDTSTGGTVIFKSTGNTVSFNDNGVPQYDVHVVKNMRFPCVVKGTLAVFVSNIEVSAWEEPSGTGAPQYGFYIANECTLPAAYNNVNDSPIVVDVSNAVIKFGVVTTAN